MELMIPSNKVGLVIGMYMHVLHVHVEYRMLGSTAVTLAKQNPCWLGTAWFFYVCKGWPNYVCWPGRVGKSDTARKRKCHCAGWGLAASSLGTTTQLCSSFISPSFQESEAISTATLHHEPMLHCGKPSRASALCSLHCSIAP